MQTHFTTQQLLIGAGAIIVIAIIGWSLWSNRAPVEEPAAVVAEPAAIAEEEEAVITDIGAAAESATIKDEIPNVAPTTNPIKNIYKNPFE